MVQRHPQHQDKAIVTLYDNIQTVAGNENNNYTETVEYDQYTVIVPWKDTLAIEVAKNLNNWLASAKSLM